MQFISNIFYILFDLYEKSLIFDVYIMVVVIVENGGGGDKGINWWQQQQWQTTNDGGDYGTTREWA